MLGPWHVLRLAEDFATLHDLSGGRAVLGVGRGTVPREMVPLSSGRAPVGSHDNPDQAAADAVNREVSDESIDLQLTALDDERFQHRGKHFQAPPPAIPDRGGEVEHLTLVPRPMYPYAVWQAITSPGSLRSVPARGFGGVCWLLNRDVLVERWTAFAANYGAAHGTGLAPATSARSWSTPGSATPTGTRSNTLLPGAPGDTYAATQDQLRRFAAQVRPALDESVGVGWPVTAPPGGPCRSPRRTRSGCRRGRARWRR